MRLGWQPEPRDLAIKRRHGVHQRNGIGVFWRAQNLTCLTRLHHLAVAHDRDAVSDLCDHADVVGDQHKGDLAAVCEVPDQIKQLVLNGDVKCCGRLVRDDQFGVGTKRESDHNALAHAAEELVRIRLDPLLCVLDPNLFEQIDGAFVGVGIAEIGMGLDRLDQLIFDRHQRVQAGLRILEDHRNAVAPDGVLLMWCQAAQVGFAKRQFAIGDVPRRRNQADYGGADGGFARATFADQAVDFAGLDNHVDIFDGRHIAKPVREFHREVFDHQHQRSLGLKTSRRKSPSTLIDTTSATRNKVGIQRIHHSPDRRNCMPIRMSVPSDGLSAGKPMPRKDSVASSKLAEARSTVMITSNGPRMFGKMCTNITRIGRWSIMIAACT